MIAVRGPQHVIARIAGWSASTTAKMAAGYGDFYLEDLRGAVEPLGSREKPEVEEGSPRFSQESDSELKTMSTKLPRKLLILKWWAVRDSNPGLPACKAGALTN